MQKYYIGCCHINDKIIYYKLLYKDIYNLDFIILFDDYNDLIFHGCFLF